MRRKHVWLAGLVLVASALAVAVIARPRATWRARKVVLITIDTLRADRLGAYGYSRRPTSPALDAWARGAVVFERAFTQAPWTIPSLGSLFTGRYPFEAGVYTNRGGISPDLATLPELFRRRGFKTASFNTHALLVNSSNGFRRGFDAVFPSEIRPAKRGQHKIPWTDTEPQLMRWLDAHAGEDRFFVWIHDMDPHAPPTVGNPFLEKPGWHGYDAEVRWVDEAIGRILAKLDALGIRDELLLVFTADHGESLGEHGLRGHQDVMYDEVLRVPLIVAYPGVERGRRITEPVALVDLLATIAELADLPVPAGNRGESLVPLIEGRRSRRSARYLFHSRYHFEDGHHELAVRDRAWKLLFRTAPGSVAAPFPSRHRERHPPAWSLDAPGGRRELYRWAADPGEKKDVVVEHAEDVARLEAILWAWWRRVSSQPGEQRREAPTLDEAGQEALRALGYE